MAFDPNIPQEDSPLDAAQMRDQLNSLNDFITVLQNQVAYLQSQITDLQNQLAAVPTMAAVNAAITANSAGPVTMVNPVTDTISNPPAKVEVEDIQDTLNYLLQKLQRN